MRHVPMATLYPWLELTCPVCDEDTDYPVHEVDCINPINSVFDDPVCCCGHRFTKSEIRSIAIFYG